MDRKGYYLKPAARASGPGVVFSVVVQPHVRPASNNERMTVRTFGRAFVSLAKRRRGRWVESEMATFDSPFELSAYMHFRSDGHRRNYVVSPTASDTLTLVKFFEEADAVGVQWAPRGGKRGRVSDRQLGGDGLWVRRCVFRGVPDILDYTQHGRRWVWLSGRQFYPQDEESLARSIGHEWKITGHMEGSAGSFLRDPAERCQLWLRFFTRLSDWWGEHANAPFGLTIGQMSVGILRSHIQKGELCTHSDPDVWALEREASFGGRASVWYVGDVGGRSAPTKGTSPRPPTSPHGTIKSLLYSIDVRSMYPFLLRERAYPTKLLSYRENVSVQELKDVLPYYCVIACVKIRTSVPEYPLRENGRIVWPKGEFTTVLTGPELVKLLSEGEILTCHRMAVYRPGRPFASAATALLNLRQTARTVPSVGGELFAKLLGNSLAGKLAQRKGSWCERRSVVPESKWGEWHSVDERTGTVTRFRSLAGLAWQWVPDASGAGPFTASFAYLTAFGRLMMRSIRSLAPDHAIVSQDTDGLWVLRDGYDMMLARGLDVGPEPGQLRFCGIASEARFFGPRHYWTDDGWVLSGFHHPSVDVANCTVEDSFERSPLLGSPSRPPTATFAISRTSVLKPIADGGWVDVFGWVQPPYRCHHPTSG